MHFNYLPHCSITKHFPFISFSIAPCSFLSLSIQLLCSRGIAHGPNLFPVSRGSFWRPNNCSFIPDSVPQPCKGAGGETDVPPLVRRDPWEGGLGGRRASLHYSKLNAVIGHGVYRLTEPLEVRQCFFYCLIWKTERPGRTNRSRRSWSFLFNGERRRCHGTVPLTKPSSEEKGRFLSSSRNRSGHQDGDSLLKKAILPFEYTFYSNFLSILFPPLCMRLRDTVRASSAVVSQAGEI